MRVRSSSSGRSIGILLMMIIVEDGGACLNNEFFGYVFFLQKFLFLMTECENRRQ